jgi:hypothetical protein
MMVTRTWPFLSHSQQQRACISLQTRVPWQDRSSFLVTESVKDLFLPWTAGVKLGRDLEYDLGALSATLLPGYSLTRLMPGSTIHNYTFA